MNTWNWAEQNSFWQMLEASCRDLTGFSFAGVFATGLKPLPHKALSKGGGG